MHRLLNTFLLNLCRKLRFAFVVTFRCLCRDITDTDLFSDIEYLPLAHRRFSISELPSFSGLLLKQLGPITAYTQLVFKQISRRWFHAFKC
jgi:hypothetical protein